MELVCSEVGKKIRSAIRVRLLELGKTVDDELIDYIMVMAANKKEESQMARDLLPFLEEDTIKFTSWLQKVLKKLEQITVTVTDNDYKVANLVDANKKIKAPVDATKKKTSTSKEEKKKKSKKGSPDAAGKKSKSTKGIKVKTSSKTTEVKGKVKEVKPKKLTKEEPASSDELDEAPASSSGPRSSVSVLAEKAEVPKMKQPVMMTSDVDDDDDDDDFINIKTDLNEEEELLGADQPKISSRVEKISDHDSESSRSRSSLRTATAITTAQLRARRNFSHRTRESSPPPKVSIRSQVIAKKRKSPSPPPRVSVMSRIGAVLKRKVEDDDDDEEMTKPKSVASVVRIKPRTTLPPEARPSKFLLLKAINEAQKSISTSKSRGNEEEEEEDTRPKLFTKNLKNRLGNMEKIQITLRNLPTHNQYEDEDVEMSTDDAYVPEISSSRALPPVTYKPSPISKQSVSNENPRTQFLITLDGYEEYSNKYLRATAEEIEMLQAQGVEMEIIDTAQLEENGAPKPKRKRIVFTPEPEELMVEEPVKKAMERCKFWPACRQGDSCAFQHPSSTCINFPNCTFGDRCLYIHPNCKFDAACTRKDCPFTHASPRNIGSLAAAVAAPKFAAAPVVRPAAPVKSGASVCRFYPGCTNMNCRFFHPKPCRFGASCKNFGCVFTHPEVAPVAKLKWVNTATV